MGNDFTEELSIARRGTALRDFDILAHAGDFGAILLNGKS